MIAAKSPCHSPLKPVLSVIAFHEKAGRSQVDSVVLVLDKVFSPPSYYCRHPSIRTLHGEPRRCFQRRVFRDGLKQLGPSPQGVLRFNWREVLFGEAATVNTNLRVLSVKFVTS